MTMFANTVDVFHIFFKAVSSRLAVHIVSAALLTIPVNDVAVTDTLICRTSLGSVAGLTRVL